jgi:hypothetical protein
VSRTTWAVEAALWGWQRVEGVSCYGICMYDSCRHGADGRQRGEETVCATLPSPYQARCHTQRSSSPVPRPPASSCQVRRGSTSTPFNSFRRAGFAHVTRWWPDDIAASCHFESRNCRVRAEGGGASEGRSGARTHSVEVRNRAVPGPSFHTRKLAARTNEELQACTACS